MGDDDPVVFYPETCIAIAKHNPAISKELDSSPFNQQPLPPKAEPEAYGARVGRMICNSPNEDWGSLFPAHGEQLELPDGMTKPGGTLGDDWCFGFYLGLLCALAVDPQGEHAVSSRADWVQKAVHGLTRVVCGRGPVRPIGG
jgi:hypothetical protein